MVACALLVVPVAGIEQSRYAAAGEQVQQADDADHSVQRLGALLTLAPALEFEKTIAVTLVGLGNLPPGAAPQELIDLQDHMEALLEDQRQAVDSAFEELAVTGLSESDDRIRSEVSDLRSEVQAQSVDYTSVAARFNEETGKVTNAAQAEVDELTVLTSAIVGGGDDLIRAVSTARSITALQTSNAAQISLWANVSVPVGTPAASDIFAFATGVARQTSAVESMDRVVDLDPVIGPMWVEFRNGEEFISLANRYSSGALEAVGAATEAGAEPTQLDLTQDAVMGLLAFVGELVEVMDLNVEASEGLSQVIEASLGQVNGAVMGLADAARGARGSVFASIALFVALMLISVVVLGRFVARPVESLARSANAVRDGDLDDHVEEKGPREIRVAARAFNESIDSLKLAERQAGALAEGRLDADVLQQSVAGALGSSLQAAVDRLTTSLGENEQFRSELAHEAAHDGLTRLPNRDAILGKISAALAAAPRSTTSVALFFLDVDGFKGINDTHGHQVGDAVLRVIGSRLVGTLRQGDVAGRLGGDEFVVLASPVANVEAAMSFARRVHDKLCEPIQLDGLTIDPGVSIGVALNDDDQVDEDELLRNADLALYRAKELGRGRIEICDDSLRMESVERSQLEIALRAAIATDELVLHYQPVIESRSGRVTSLEALVRWERPGIGRVPPGDFIPVAERSDLILELDRWVLSAAAKQIASWSGNRRLGGLAVSVNISGAHLSSRSLVRSVTETIERVRIPAGRLAIEVTETALLGDLAAASHDLAVLRDLGVGVALDDFGTGYMSLAMLRELPVDVLKVDRSFVNQLDSDRERSLVELIIGSGHLLGATVTAEGVETQQQSDVLDSLGADMLQGFLFTPALAPDALESYMETYVGRPAAARI